MASSADRYGDEVPPSRSEQASTVRSSRSSSVRRPGRMLAVAVAAVGIAAMSWCFAGSAAAAVGISEVTHGPAKLPPAVPSNKEIAYCYKSVNIFTREIKQHIPVGINGDGPNGRGDITKYIMDICARDGWGGDDWGFRQPGQSSIPQLSPCVLDSWAVKAVSGAVGVFPGADACERLGLAPAII